jgi:hypothetical protein
MKTKEQQAQGEIDILIMLAKAWQEGARAVVNTIGEKDIKLDNPYLTKVEEITKQRKHG